MDELPALRISELSKRYGNGFQALSRVDLDIPAGEIFALLGPNGAGKTTLISIICGIVTASHGRVLVHGHDHQVEYREARKLIGLVPQELHTDAFETVWATVRFSRGLFGLPPDDAYLEGVLGDLSLWDKKSTQIRMLSGGMKRRLLIAKALAHQPRILFLDEPTAGVDVELRRTLWEQVERLRQRGVTIVLTTHYIQEAQELADRVGIIQQGQLRLVEDTAVLMQQLGRRELRLHLEQALDQPPADIGPWDVRLDRDGEELVLHFDAQTDTQLIPRFLARVQELGIAYRDIRTSESSLEDIFVGLLNEQEAA